MTEFLSTVREANNEPTTHDLDAVTYAVDPEALRSLANVIEEERQARVTEIIRLYLEETPRLFEQFQQGLSTRDLTAIQQAAHALSASSALVGAYRFSQLAVALEHLCHKHSWIAITNRSHEFRAEYERVMAHFCREYALRYQRQIDLST